MTTSRAGTPPGLSSSFQRLSTHADDWGPARVLDEGLDLVRDASWADQCHLYAIRPHAAVQVASRPTRRACGDDSGSPLDWFPWGLAPVNPTRFVLVADARGLPASASATTTLGDLGARSCLHLPILERERPIGALHLYWSEPRLEWDDERGRLLRLLGGFLLGRCPA